MQDPSSVRTHVMTTLKKIIYDVVEK